MTKAEKFILKWAIITLTITILVIVLFFNNVQGLVKGLILGAVFSFLKFTINSYNIKRLVDNKTSMFSNVILSVISFGIYLIAFGLILAQIREIDLKLIIGICVGVTYLPIVIVIIGILESMYIIRTKP